MSADTSARAGEPGRSETVASAASEPRRERFARHAHRTRLYATAVVFVVVVVILIGLAIANNRSVKLDWIVGSSHASLVWIVLAATVLGWVLGITTSVLFRYRTRRTPSR
jgi:uncharacterized integral membrane protein